MGEDVVVLLLEMLLHLQSGNKTENCHCLIFHARNAKFTGLVQLQGK